MDTIYTKNAPNAIGPYSQAVKIGDMLYTSGQIAINPATGNVEATDIVGPVSYTHLPAPPAVPAPACTPQTL